MTVISSVLATVNDTTFRSELACFPQPCSKLETMVGLSCMISNFCYEESILCVLQSSVVANKYHPESTWNPVLISVEVVTRPGKQIIYIYVGFSEALFKKTA